MNYRTLTTCESAEIAHDIESKLCAVPSFVASTTNSQDAIHFVYSNMEMLRDEPCDFKHHAIITTTNSEATVFNNAIVRAMGFANDDERIYELLYEFEHHAHAVSTHVVLCHYLLTTSLKAKLSLA